MPLCGKLINKAFPCSLFTDVCLRPAPGRGKEWGMISRNSLDTLAEAILALLDDPARARAMGRAGHTKALEHYSWARVADRVLGHVEALGAAEPAER